MTDLRSVENRIETLVERMWFWQSELDACQDDKRAKKIERRIDGLEKQIEDLQLQAEYL